MSNINNFRLLKCLKNITYGEIYLSQGEKSDKYFITKRLRREQVDKPEAKNYLKQIDILKQLKHPNICKLVDFKKDHKYYYLVYEFINGGCLSDCFEQYKRKYHTPFFPEEIIQYIMRQVVDAFKYIHGKNIIHRKIKLENIMVNYSNNEDLKNLNLLKAKIKIIDFSSAVQGFGRTIFESNQNMHPLLLKKYNENLSRKSENLIYDIKIDIWSLGAICYQMLIGKPIFDANSLEDLIKKVKEGVYTVPTILSREVVSFLNSMLQINPENRLSIEELSQHPFLIKDFREFRKIPLKKSFEKNNQYELNINFNKHHTIWSIFAEDDEKKLSDIKQKEDNFNQKSKSEYSSLFPSYPKESPTPSTFVSSTLISENKYSKISNNSNMSNTHHNPNEEKYNYNYFPKIQKSFYGQNMHSQNQNNQNSQYMYNIQINNNIQNFKGRNMRMLLPRQNSGDIIPPSNNMYINFNIGPDIYGQKNQVKYGDNKGIINNVPIINSKNYCRPMDNEESIKENGLCCIM